MLTSGLNILAALVRFETHQHTRLECFLRLLRLIVLSLQIFDLNLFLLKLLVQLRILSIELFFHC